MYKIELQGVTPIDHDLIAKNLKQDIKASEVETSGDADGEPATLLLVTALSVAAINALAIVFGGPRRQAVRTLRIMIEMPDGRRVSVEEFQESVQREGTNPDLVKALNGSGLKELLAKAGAAAGAT